MQTVERKALLPGVSARTQLRAQRTADPHKDWRYLPHQGARERARRAKQIAAGKVKASA